MTVTESRKVLDNALASFDSTVDMGIKQSMAGKEVTPKVQAVIDEMRGKMVTVFKEALAWKDMEPLFIQVYQRSLTQEEVNGMIRFYESDAGKAVVRKLPLIMQNTLAADPGRSRGRVPKITQIQQETMEKVKAAAAAKSAAARTDPRWPRAIRLVHILLPGDDPRPIRTDKGAVR